MGKTEYSIEQKAFMKKYHINYLNDDEVLDKADHLLRTQGFDEDYNPTAIGTMCESILDTLADIEDEE